MIYFTPQEKSVIAGCVCVLAAGILAQAVFVPTSLTSRIKQYAREGKAPVPDINHATVRDLEAIPGIGKKTAHNIVAYREANGVFLRFADLLKVKGVTKARLKKIELFYQSIIHK